VPKSDDTGGEMMPFLYKERKRRESTMSGVLKMADYRKIEPNAELREKIIQEANKHS
jgi:hypothetical protein